MSWAAAANLCGEAGGEDEGSGRAVGREVGREEAKPGDRLNADASAPGRHPNNLILDVFPRKVGEEGGCWKRSSLNSSSNA